jgi:hypothetical protein
MAMTRAEYLGWAKNRALARLDMGDLNGALRSLLTDLANHDQLRDDPRIAEGLEHVSDAWFAEPQRLREFIEGFH